MCYIKHHIMRLLTALRVVIGLAVTPVVFILLWAAILVAGALSYFVPVLNIIGMVEDCLDFYFPDNNFDRRWHR